MRSPSGAYGRGGGARLAPETALQLARWGMRLENLAGRPQDIEWCQDQHENLYLLQSRPLTTGTFPREPGEIKTEPREIANPVLLEGGVTASPGLGMGQVCLVQRKEDLAKVPEGAVLVSPTLPPDFSVIIHRLRAVVADLGRMLGQRVRQEVIQRAVEVNRCLRELQPDKAMDDLEEGFAAQYRQAHILCPLNELGQCLLFENRPVACRLFDLPREDRREVTLGLQQGLARLSREVWFAFTSSFPGNIPLTFSLSAVVSGKFVQGFFHRLIQGQ